MTQTKEKAKAKWTNPVWKSTLWQNGPDEDKHQLKETVKLVEISINT
jgi:hypothetical protein